MKGPADTQVISKSYLTGLIVKCGLFFSIGLILTGIVLFFSAQQPLGPSYQESFARLAQLKQEMLFKSIIIYFTIMILIMAGVIIITLMYSHRVVGPLIGLKRIISGLKEGDLTQPAILRTKDAIKPMADALNDMMGAYKKIVSDLNNKTKELGNLAQNAKDKQGIKLLQEKADEIAAILGGLKF